MVPRKTQSEWWTGYMTVRRGCNNGAFLNVPSPREVRLWWREARESSIAFSGFGRQIPVRFPAASTRPLLNFLLSEIVFHLIGSMSWPVDIALQSTPIAYAQSSCRPGSIQQAVVSRSHFIACATGQTMQARHLFLCRASHGLI